LGSVPDIKAGLLPFYLRARREHGDFLRVQFTRFFGWYFLAHPNDVERVLLASHKSFEKGVLWSRLKIVLGDGLLTSDGEVWQSHRRAMQPAFHRRYHRRILASDAARHRTNAPSLEGSGAQRPKLRCYE
jgi:cytochrome P450